MTEKQIEREKERKGVRGIMIKEGMEIKVQLSTPIILIEWTWTSR